MKVDYKIVGAAGGYTTLFDESAGDASPTFKPTFKDSVMSSPGFGAASQGQTPMLDTEVTLEIPLVRVYTSAANAKAAIRALRGALKGLRLNLRVTQGTDIDYYPSAVLESLSASLEGSTVVYSLQFKSQDVTGTEPS